MKTTEPPAVTQACVTITQGQLERVMLKWQFDYRLGLARSAEESDALPPAQVASESAAYLWGLLTAIPFVPV
jgi:hypothetical protein